MIENKEKIINISENNNRAGVRKVMKLITSRHKYASCMKERKYRAK